MCGKNLEFSTHLFLLTNATVMPVDEVNNDINLTQGACIM